MKCEGVEGVWCALSGPRKREPDHKKIARMVPHRIFGTLFPGYKSAPGHENDVDSLGRMAPIYCISVLKVDLVMGSRRKLPLV